MHSFELRPNDGEIEAFDATANDAERYVLGVVLPTWMAAGGLDYLLHRRSNIEGTTGTYESRLHLLGIALTAPAVLAGLVLEINSGVVALMGVTLVAHVGMTVWDVSYADDRRTIVPLEQHVHALLELLPFSALSLLAIAHGDATRALVGIGPTKPDFSFRFKRKPISRRILVATIVTFTIVVAVPYAEEFLRCVRYDRKRSILAADTQSQHGQIEHAEEQRVPHEAERETHTG